MNNQPWSFIICKYSAWANVHPSTANGWWCWGSSPLRSQCLAPLQTEVDLSRWFESFCLSVKFWPTLMSCPMNLASCSSSCSLRSRSWQRVATCLSSFPGSQELRGHRRAVTSTYVCHSCKEMRIFSRYAGFISSFYQQIDPLLHSLHQENCYLPSSFPLDLYAS